MPRPLYERAKMVSARFQAASFNEFVVQAIEEKVQRLTEAEIDGAFAQMADDPNYQSSSISLAKQFEMSDWNAFSSGPPPKKIHAKTQTRASHAGLAKARSR